MSKLVQGDETYAILGACFEVYREMGCGFLEAVYQDCLKSEFADRGVPFVEKPRLELAYKGRAIEHTYEPDFRCFGDLIVELKAVSKLADEHRAQLHNYLKATGCRVGLLVNFGHHPLLEHERIIH